MIPRLLSALGALAVANALVAAPRNGAALGFHSVPATFAAHRAANNLCYDGILRDRREPRVCQILSLRAGVEDGDSWEQKLLTKIPGYRRPRHGTMRVTLPKKDAQNSVTPPATAPRSSNPLLSTFEALQAALQQNSAKAPVKAQSEPKEETPKAPMGKAELMEAAREAAREPAAGQAVLPSEPRLMRLEAPAVEVKTAAAAEAARQALEAQRRREEVVAKRRREEALAQRRRELPEEARLVRDRIKIPPLDLPWGEALAHQGLGASDRLPGGAWRIVPRDDSMTPYRRPGRKALLQDMQQRLARHGTLTVVENAAMILGHHHVSRRQLDRMILKSSEKSASAGNSDIP